MIDELKFADQSHINRVRDALWKRSENATVMVGAGFSKNGVSLRTEESAPPLWSELADALRIRLYPPQDNESYLGTTDATQSKEILRLAEEYEAAFGRPELHRLMQELIRDDELEPGIVHEKLLQLPWRNVFTTNWDTLLERANTLLPNRAYSIVRNAEEIPLAATPRIVKLHGSVDPYHHLIVTEEDYRTYPNCFAPFVNTVRQAMMETILFLIGFSGEDQNFLHWSGWVRDKLSDSAPKIYLAGWLDLTSHRRRSLESRNIVPIDLARHPAANQWRIETPDVRHKRATEWILQTLEFGEPYNLAKWPKPIRPKDELIPDYLHPLEKKPVSAPMEEPDILDSSSNGQCDETKRQRVQELISVWKYNRTNTYPGWLSAPTAVRTAMSGSTQYSVDTTITILDTLPLLTVEERLTALFELIWRWEIQLLPILLVEDISARFLVAAKTVLDQIDIQRNTIAGEKVDEVSWSTICEARIGVVLAFARAARFRCDFKEFENWLSSLSSFQSSHVYVRHSVTHERCLWAILVLDFPTLQELLAQWDVEKGDPVWMMRKAALLFEIGHDVEAQNLITLALQTVRRMPEDDTKVLAQTRESWALYCSGSSLNFEESLHDWFEKQNRWDELTVLQCNAPLEMLAIENAIRGKEKFEQGRPFDLGVEFRPGHSYSMADYLRWSAAHRAIRLTEVVGLPPKINIRDIASSILQLAARELCAYDLELAARIVIRSAESESRSTLNVVLSRTNVARLPNETASELAKSCITAIEFTISLFRDSSTTNRQRWLTRLRVFVESLSRFVVRLKPDQVEEVLTKSLDWYSNVSLISSFLLENSIKNLLARAWCSLPSARRLTRIRDLFLTPIVGMDELRDGKEKIRKNYPDPCDLLHYERRGFWVSENDIADWTSVVNSIALGLKHGGEARQRAARRLGWLAEANILKDEYFTRIALSLWGDQYLENNNLPTNTGLHEWAFLLLPEPQSGIAESRFRGKWLNPESRSETDLSHTQEVLFQVGSALCNLQIHKYSFTLSSKDRTFLNDVVSAWSKEPIPDHLLNREPDAPSFFYYQDDEKLDQVIDGLSYVLLEIELSETIANKLMRKVQELNHLKVPSRELYPGLVKVNPNLFQKIVDETRIALVSEDKHTARNAFEALQFWLRTALERLSDLAFPTIDLVREIGIIVATRRKVALANALRLAEWIYRKGDSNHKEAIQEFLVEGLGFLSQELRYNKKHEEEIDVPLLRFRCASLAVAMSKNGCEDDPTILQWLQDAENDPLPEVRFCVLSSDLNKD